MHIEIKAEIAIFQQEIQRGRFDDKTLRILESILVCKDVKSLMEMRFSLREFMRSKSLSVMRAITEKAVSEKLRILEFFVRAFALLGDAKSCFALKYEALLLRQVESSSCQSLQVSYMEWLNFAGNLIDNGCYPVARQACENALLCLQKDGVANSKTSEFPVDKRIKSLREYAVKFAAPSSELEKILSTSNKHAKHNRLLADTLTCTKMKQTVLTRGLGG